MDGILIGLWRFWDFPTQKRGENSDMINLLAFFPHDLAAEDSIHLNAAGYQRLWGHPSLQTAMECTIEHSVSSAPHRTSLGALLFAFGLALNGSERNNSPWESLVAHKQGWNCCSLFCFTGMSIGGFTSAESKVGEAHVNFFRFTRWPCENMLSCRCCGSLFRWPVFAIFAMAWYTVHFVLQFVFYCGWPLGAV